MIKIVAGILGIWNRFWYKEDDGTNLFVGRIIFYGFLFCLYFDSWGGDSLLQWAEISRQFWDPISFFAVLPLYTDSKSILHIITVVWFTSLGFSCLGLFTRVSTKVCFFSGLYFLGYSNNFGKIHHLHHLPLLIMGVLAFSDCGDGHSLDFFLRRSFGSRDNKKSEKGGNYSWSLKLIHTTMVLVYFSAGMQKLVNSGLGWAFSDNLKNMLLAWGEPSGNWFVMHFGFLCPVLAAATFFGELLAPLALFNRRAAAIIIPDLFLFHLGARILMGNAASFTPWMICFVFWLPFTRIGGYLRSRFLNKPCVGEIEILIG